MSLKFRISGILLWVSVLCSGQANYENQTLLFINQLVSQEFERCTESFDETVASKLDAKAMEKIWSQLQKQLGSYMEHGKVETQKEKNFEITHCLLVFERGAVKLRLVFNQYGNIAGLFFLPSDPPKYSDSPAYAKASKFTEESIKIKNGNFKLTGILCRPVNPTNYPVVILVHGSGPNDMDETIGPNKIFRDLAHGLASKGIASVRYNKRTWEYPMECAEIKDFTINDETVLDAVAAVAFSKSIKNVDTSRIYVLGHSLGAYAAPRIAAACNDVKGIIVMAGNARPLEDLLRDQFHYLFNLDGVISNEEKESLQMLTSSIERLTPEKLAGNISSDSLPLGIPAAYWRDLALYKPLETASQLNIKILVLQGERDYQVSMIDFNMWKKALQSNKLAEFRSFKKLNHLMMKGKGKPNPSEYMKPANVDYSVIKTISSWIQ